jgi:fatty acid desaturase
MSTHERPWRLNNAHDRICLVYHALTVAAFVLAWYRFEQGFSSALDASVFVISVAFMLGITAGIDVVIVFHNHMHRPFCRSDSWNRWLGRSWAVFGGWPSYFLCHSHLTVHHRHTMAAADWSGPRTLPDGRVEGIVRYSFASWPFRAVAGCWNDFRGPQMSRSIKREAGAELCLFGAFWLTPFLIDWRAALLLWLLPHWVANSLLFASGTYAQHAGCVPITVAYPHSHSISSTSKVDAVIMFNNCHHTAHHEYPAVHWTRLPGISRRHAAEYESSGSECAEGYFARSATLLRNSINTAARARPTSPAPTCAPLAIGTHPLGDYRATTSDGAALRAHDSYPPRWWSKAAPAVGRRLDTSRRVEPPDIAVWEWLGRCFLPLFVLAVLGLLILFGPVVGVVGALVLRAGLGRFA